MHMKLIFTSVAVLVSLLVAMGSLAQAPPTRPAAPAGPVLSPAEQQEIARELEGKVATLKQGFDQRLNKLDADMKAKVEASNREFEQVAKAEEAKAQEKIGTWRTGLQGKKPEEFKAGITALQSELERMMRDLASRHSSKMKELEGDFTRQAGALETEFQAEVGRLVADLKRKYPKLQQVPTR